jgi:anti-sigma B factor antagonist
MSPREATSFRTVVGAGAVVVEAAGELDAASSGRFRTVLAEAVDAGKDVVVVDLSRVSFLDSAGLSVIFAAQRRLPAEQRLVLGEVPTRMLRTLRLAAVGAVVDLCPEGEEQPWREALGPVA